MPMKTDFYTYICISSLFMYKDIYMYLLLGTGLYLQARGKSLYSLMLNKKIENFLD